MLLIKENKSFKHKEVGRTCSL